MAASLDDAIRRLESAVGLLDASISRRLEAERRRSDLEIELQIMQDDRARLAVELDGASERLIRVEATADDVGKRVTRAIEAIRNVIDNAERAEIRE